MAQRTPLYERHRAAGARVVDFAGWDMPVSYTSAVEEHRAVRERCGLFDVSHMGELEICGPGAVAWCNRVTVNDVTRLGDGDGQYSVLCDDAGGVIDDLIVYRLAADRLLLVVNAANLEVDTAWLAAQRGTDCELRDHSGDMGLLALQGPRAVAVLASLGRGDVGSMRPFTIREMRVADLRVLVARTGYTGEDGFEIVVPVAGVGALWDALVEAMQPFGGLPCGLAARDTLRLEAALPLCGSDMDRTTTPLEAGLGWVVKLGKGEFVGREALVVQHRDGVRRRLAGLEMDEAGVPRHGQRVLVDGHEVGQVTSGTKSPTLGSFIAMAYVAAAQATPGTRVAVEMRGRHHGAHVVERPFYRRAR